MALIGDAFCACLSVRTQRILEITTRTEKATHELHGHSVQRIREILVSVIFPPAILRLEMAALILWAPGHFWLFLQENPCPQNSSFQGGGGGCGLF